MIRTCARKIIRQRFCFSSSLKKEALQTLRIASLLTNEIQQPCHVRWVNQSKTTIRSFSTTESTFTMEYEIPCSELYEDIENNKSVYIIDVRQPSEIETQGKIPGSFLIPCKLVCSFSSF